MTGGLPLPSGQRCVLPGLRAVAQPISPRSKPGVPEGHRAALSRGQSTNPTLWMDGIHFAPPKRPWKDDSPVNAKRGFPWFPTDAGFVHPPYGHLLSCVRD